MKELGDIEWQFHKTGNVQELKGLQEKVLKALRKADGTPVDEFEKLFENPTSQRKFARWTKQKQDQVSAESLLEWLDKSENFNIICTIED